MMDHERAAGDILNKIKAKSGSVSDSAPVSEHNDTATEDGKDEEFPGAGGLMHHARMLHSAIGRGDHEGIAHHIGMIVKHHMSGGKY